MPGKLRGFGGQSPRLELQPPLPLYIGASGHIRGRSFDYGQLLECEHTNPVNGDALQITSKGMFVYQKSSNEPRYTDGYNSYAWNTNGLNAWQGDRQGPASAPSAPVATETPVSKEVPWQQITTTSWETYNPDGSVSGKFFYVSFQ